MNAITTLLVLWCECFREHIVSPAVNHEYLIFMYTVFKYGQRLLTSFSID